VSSPRTVSLNHCALKRQSFSSPIHLDLTRPDRAERRRRSLRRGIDRWHQDVLTRARASPRVALIALTVKADDPMAARGAIRRFWMTFRRTYGKRPYFSWAELQARGAIHYHALVVNPPWRLARQARRWLKDSWPLSELTPSYEQRDWRWFCSRGGQYVRAYAKKPLQRARAPVTTVVGPVLNSPKLHKFYKRRSDFDRSGESQNTETDVRSPTVNAVHYQQRYELLPREIRTWESSRLAHKVAELDAHRDRPDIVCTTPSAPWSTKVLNFWQIGRILHVTPPGRCTLALNNHRPSASQPAKGLLLETSGGSAPKAPWRSHGRQVEPSSHRANPLPEQQFSPHLPLTPAYSAPG